MFCDKCGYKIQDNRGVCPICGNKIRVSTVKDITNYNNVKRLNAYDSQMLKNDGFFKIPIVVKIFGIFAIVMVSLIFFCKSDFGSSLLAEIMVSNGEYKSDYNMISGTTEDNGNAKMVETTTHTTTIANTAVSKNEKERRNEELQKIEQEREYEKSNTLNSFDTHSTNGTAIVDDVEGEVKNIRKKYYYTQNNLSSFTQFAIGKYTFYENDSDGLLKIDFPLDNSNYNACFYYNNYNLYFAFIFDNKKENRFYFYDNSIFRWIDESGTILDNVYDNYQLNNWYSIIQTESNNALNVLYSYNN